MARKKSAAKKAKEAAEKQNVESKPVEPKETSKKPVAEPEPEFDDDYSNSESSEEEDEYGELITEDVEQGINKVIDLIKNDPKKLLDPNVKFFDEKETDGKSNESKKEKPIYLKDYHRMNLLSGGYKNQSDDEENGDHYNTVDGEKPFVVVEREERNKLLSDINNAFEGGDDDDDENDDFLKKKTPTEKSRREIIEETVLPDPEKDSKSFLDAFVSKQAWIPKKNDKIIDLDRIDNEVEEEFDDAVENFEKAYNFRYEDANSAEIVSYARNQATLRRSATNARKRKREKEHEKREQENREKEEALKKKKIQKVNAIADRLLKIKEAVGDDVPDSVIEKVFGDSLLNDDFDDADWDAKMAQIFDEQYYGNQDADVDLKKPEWEDDEPLDGKIDDEEDADDNDDDNDDDDDHDDHGDDDDDEKAQNQEAEEGSSKKTKKDKLKEKKSKKKEKERIKEKAQEIVEANKMKILSEVAEERGRAKEREGELKFKYREVSPESFGLTTRDILLADDKQLNSYIGLKKFAPYRPKELRMKDKRKYAKKKHLKEWQKETFGKIPKAPQDTGKPDEIWIPVEGSLNEKSEKDKKSKHKKKNKKN